MKIYHNQDKNSTCLDPMIITNGENKNSTLVLSFAPFTSQIQDYI